ncbi:MAG: LPS assembly lipoprotein LptE [Gallionellaceae bacterium]|nr:LPS assembly lipoprotein LptE [Gallionellaceae bacterium]
MRIAISLLLIISLLALSACGFHLKGHGGKKVNLAFQSVYLKAGETLFVTDLRTALTNNKVLVATSPEQATITLEIISEASDKQVLSLSSAGKVLEFELRYLVKIHAYDSQLDSWLPESEIELKRTLTYDDTQVLAKEQEEATLLKDMRSDAVSQTIRRLSRARPPKSENANK